MASFDKYAPTLVKWEGGFVNDPDDAGGATMMGVTLATYRQWYGLDKSVSDLKNISYDEWRAIMKGGYWDKCKADLFCNQSVAEIMVDWCVNAGTARIKDLQRILGVKDDGIIGSKTMAAVNASDQRCLHCKIKKAREAYYINLANSKPANKKFLQGWLNRVYDFVFGE